MSVRHVHFLEVIHLNVEKFCAFKVRAEVKNILLTRDIILNRNRTLLRCFVIRSASEYYRKTLVLPFFAQHVHLNMLTLSKDRICKRRKTNFWRIGMQFYVENLDFLDKSLPLSENFIFQLNTSVMTAVSNPFMTRWYRQFHMRTTQWHFQGYFQIISVMMRRNWSLPCVHTTKLTDCKYANALFSLLVDM